MRKVVSQLHKVTFLFPGPCNTRSMSNSVERRIAGKLAALLCPLLLGACATAAQRSALADPVPGQRAWAAACEDNDSWDKPAPPFRVYGNTWYVGTCGITALLVDGDTGLTLLDTGTQKGAEIVLQNIDTLGFQRAEIETILTSHEHFDHVGGIARVQDATGATIVTTEPAGRVLRSGRPGAGDPQAASGHPDFPPATGRIDWLGDNNARLFGGERFTPIATPGHTPGAMSWQWQSCEGSECKTIVYVDSLNPISANGYRFSDHPELVAGMRAGIAKIAAAECDIVIAPHPGAVNLRRRLLGEMPLLDRQGCRAFAATATERLDNRLATERAGG